MSRVGALGSEGGSTVPLQDLEQRRAGRQDRDPWSQGRPRDTGEGLSRQDMRFDQPGLGGGYDERQTQLLEKVQRALGQDARLDDASEDRAVRVLAVAGELLPLPGAFQFRACAPAEAGPLRSTAAERVETLTARIEGAIRAELSAPSGRDISLSLDLGQELPGIGGLTITLSAASIEVVLIRSGTEPPAEYVAAAQALADRLQARFAKRLVRIVETDPSPASGRPQGLDEIARLLRRSDATS